MINQSKKNNNGSILIPCKNILETEYNFSDNLNDYLVNNINTNKNLSNIVDDKKLDAYLYQVFYKNGFYNNNEEIEDNKDNQLINNCKLINRGFEPSKIYIPLSKTIIKNEIREAKNKNIIFQK